MLKNILELSIPTSFKLSFNNLQPSLIIPKSVWGNKFSTKYGVISFLVILFNTKADNINEYNMKLSVLNVILFKFVHIFFPTNSIFLNP